MKSKINIKIIGRLNTFFFILCLPAYKSKILELTYRDQLALHHVQNKSLSSQIEILFQEPSININQATWETNPTKAK